MSSGSETPPHGAEPDPSVPAPIRRHPWFAIRGKRRVVALAAVIVLGAVAGWRYRVTRPEYRFDRGLQAVADRDWTIAERAADRLKASGQLDRSHVLRAEILYSQKAPEGALAECNQVRPDGGALHLRAATLSGKCLLDLGEPMAAAHAFAFVIDEQPDNVDAHRGLAAAAYDLGQTNKALEHLEQVARLDVSDYRPHRLSGNIHRDAGNWSQAEGEYREALRLVGDRAAVTEEIQSELAAALVHQAKFPEALAVLGEVGSRGAETPQTAAVRAEVLRGLGRTGEAITQIDQALTNNPTGPLFRLRGQLALDQGDSTTAISNLEEAVRLGRVPYQAYFLLAQAYRLSGRADDAARATKRAEELRRDVEMAAELSRQATERPWDPSVRLHLAAIFDRLDEPDLAAMWRRAAASLTGRP
jgi:tetratricopeptide (TPR) repeat protein